MCLHYNVGMWTLWARSGPMRVDSDRRVATTQMVGCKQYYGPLHGPSILETKTRTSIMILCEVADGKPF